jgi:hypothetical protein
MAKYHIYSKLANTMHYHQYGDAPVGGGAAPIIHTVTIKGGAGVANKHIITPVGVHTEIDDADMESLNANPVYLMHKKNGFVTALKKNADVEKVVADMGDAQDKSTPLTPADFLEAAKMPTTALNSAALLGMRKT